MDKIKSIPQRKKKLLGEVLIYTCIELYFFFFFFKFIRDMTAPPRIGEQEIVGYSHYTGYPIFVDTVLFFVLMSIPIASCFIVFLRKKLTKFIS